MKRTFHYFQVELAKQFVLKYGLNEDQSQALKLVVDMICEGKKTTSPIMLVHGKAIHTLKKSTFPQIRIFKNIRNPIYFYINGIPTPNFENCKVATPTPPR